MKSKEEILHEHTIDYPFVLTTRSEHNILKVMDIYAKQQAVEMIEWMKRNNIYKSGSFYNMWVYQLENLTSEELYAKFQESQQSK